jgi:hypothetical protein
MIDHAVLQSLHRGAHLAAGIPSSIAGRLAWVGVYPLNRHSSGSQIVLRKLGVPVPTTDEPLYRVRAFEVDERLMADENKIWEGVLHNLCDTIALGDDALKAKLAELGVRMEQLDLPSRSDYPI